MFDRANKYFVLSSTRTPGDEPTTFKCFEVFATQELGKHETQRTSILLCVHLGRDVYVARRLGLAAEADSVVLLLTVLLHVLLGAREDLLLLGGGRLSPIFASSFVF